jgi:hypothetical protein
MNCRSTIARSGRSTAYYLAGLLICSACGSDGSSPAADDAGPTEAGAIGSDAGASPVPDAAVNDTDAADGSVRPTCIVDNWGTYGKDAQRTSASGGCGSGPFTVAWHYAPAPPAGKTVTGMYAVVAQADAAFVAWGVSGTPSGTTACVDRVSAAGASMWSFVPGFGDWGFEGWWPTLALGSVVFASDGLFWLDAGTGALTHGYGVDYWGPTASDGARMYHVNTWFVDGPKTFVGAYDAAGAMVWKGNEFGGARLQPRDNLGGLAVDAGKVFQAAVYDSVGTSGVFAFDAATGAPAWSQRSTPSSALSVSAGAVYDVEAQKLVSRNASDGTQRWSVDQASNSPAPPALGGGHVLVSGVDGAISARNTSDGALAWTSAPMESGFSHQTAFVVALGSGTVVAVGRDARSLHVLSLQDGHEIWTGAIPGIDGTVSSPVLVGKRLYLVHTKMGGSFEALALDGS